MGLVGAQAATVISRYEDKAASGGGVAAGVGRNQGSCVKNRT